MMQNLWLIFGFMLALSLLLATVSYAQSRWKWHPEVGRKTVHILMGISCLLFPLMFNEIYPVWILVTLTISLLAVVRFNKRGRKLMGSALHSVERESLGDIWYALAVALVYTLAFYQQQPILFWIPILILAFSDASAALIGVRYGKLKFTASEGKKSIEGSVAFAITCFFLVAFPLAIVSDASALTVLLVSLILGLLIMLVEGASWKGIDNLFIPLGSFFLLHNYLQFHEWLLMAHTLVLVFLTCLFLWLRKRTLLDGSGLLGVILLSFFFWSIGGIKWLIAPALYFFLYTYFSYRRGQNERYIHDIKSVLSIGGVSSMCLVADLIWSNSMWFAGFIAAFAAQLTITGIARREFYAQENSQNQNVLIAWLQGTFYILLPCTFLVWRNEAWLIGYWLALTSFGLVISSLLFIYWQPSINFLPRDSSRWWRQALSSLPTTAIGITAYAGLFG